MEFKNVLNIAYLGPEASFSEMARDKFCEKYNIPLVCGGIDGFYGVCYLYIPAASSCPDCAGLNISSKAMYNISSVAGIIGSLQANLALRYLITEDINLSGKLTVFDETDFSTLTVRASKECSKCKQIHCDGTA